jgi:hypothetical protein
MTRQSIDHGPTLQTCCSLTPALPQPSLESLSRNPCLRKAPSMPATLAPVMMLVDCRLSQCAERRAARTADGFQNAVLTTLSLGPITLLQVLGLPHGRYGALSISWAASHACGAESHLCRERPDPGCGPRSCSGASAHHTAPGSACNSPVACPIVLYLSISDSGPNRGSNPARSHAVCTCRETSLERCQEQRRQFTTDDGVGAKTSGGHEVVGW